MNQADGKELTVDAFFEHLKSKSVIQEQAFSSSVPLVGPLIVWFRQMWNSISTRWYVLPLIQQQNEFNEALIVGLQERFAEIDERHAQLEQCLVDLDRDQVELGRKLAEVQYAVIGLARRLDAGQGDAHREEDG